MPRCEIFVRVLEKLDDLHYAWCDGGAFEPVFQPSTGSNIPWITYAILRKRRNSSSCNPCRMQDNLPRDMFAPSLFVNMLQSFALVAYSSGLLSRMLLRSDMANEA